MGALVESGRDEIQLVAIKDLGPVETGAHLLRYDSAHGHFKGDITVDGNSFDFGMGKIAASAERDPASLPWGDVDVVLECTGVFTARATPWMREVCVCAEAHKLAKLDEHAYLAPLQKEL